MAAMGHRKVERASGHISNHCGLAAAYGLGGVTVSGMVRSKHGTSHRDAKELLKCPHKKSKAR